MPIIVAKDTKLINIHKEINSLFSKYQLNNNKIKSSRLPSSSTKNNTNKHTIYFTTNTSNNENLHTTPGSRLNSSKEPVLGKKPLPSRLFSAYK